MVLRLLSAERDAVALHNFFGTIAFCTLLCRRCYKGIWAVTSSFAFRTCSCFYRHTRTTGTFSNVTDTFRARSHCGKQNAKRCVFITVARQICILEYGVSLSSKRGLKRTQTKTGVSEGGGEDSRKRKRSQTRVQKCTLFFEKKKREKINFQLSQRFSRRH